jgi:hypothetical protein
LIFLGILGGTGYFCYTLYHSYDMGYKKGHDAGVRFADYAKAQHLRALGLSREMTRYTTDGEAGMKDTTWKDQLYKHGWESGMNDACVDLPR